MQLIMGDIVWVVDDYFVFSMSVCMYMSLCVRTYHVRNNHVTCIVAMRSHFSRLRQFRWLLVLLL